MLEQPSQLRREKYFYNLISYFRTSSRDQEDQLIISRLTTKKGFPLIINYNNSYPIKKTGGLLAIIGFFDTILVFL